MPRSAHSRDYKVFRELLRSLRRDAELTQEDVAGTLGVHQSYVSKYETGERRLDVVELLAVCKALKIPPSTFLKQLEGRLLRK